MKYTKRMNMLIKKLNMIYRKGYMPIRDRESYNVFHALSINCYSHACFNITNKDLHKLDNFDDELTRFMLDFRDIGDLHNHIKEAGKRLKKVGLKLEKSSISEDIKKNQWKVAFYVRDGDENTKSDYHYMIQLGDGKWASKMGHYETIDTFEKLPKSFYGSYNLVGVYKITNPYIKLDNEENMTM